MKKIIRVSVDVEVTVDEAKFTEQFMEEFRQSFYPFGTIEEHIEHLAQLTSMAIIPETKHWTDSFIEGYGPAEDMGILTSIVPRSQETEVVE